MSSPVHHITCLLMPLPSRSSQRAAISSGLGPFFASLACRLSAGLRSVFSHALVSALPSLVGKWPLDDALTSTCGFPGNLPVSGINYDFHYISGSLQRGLALPNPTCDSAGLATHPCPSPRRCCANTVAPHGHFGDEPSLVM